MSSTDLARTLFGAFERGDADAVRAICHPDTKVRQNAGAWMGIEALIGFTAAVLGTVRDFRYENIVCAATDSGFVEEHDVCGTLPDGTLMRAAACVVGEVRDGKLVQAREYIDTAAVAGLLRALEGNG